MGFKVHHEFIFYVLVFDYASSSFAASLNLVLFNFLKSLNRSYLRRFLPVRKHRLNRIRRVNNFAFIIIAKQSLELIRFFSVII